MIAWRIERTDEGLSTFVADFFDADINRSAFREVWKSIISKMQRDHSPKWRRIVAHIAEEPWQWIVYQCDVENIERDHSSYFMINFVEHNGKLDVSAFDELERNNPKKRGLMAQLIGLLKDRIMQISAAALEDVCRGQQVFQSQEMTDVVFEIWDADDEVRLTLDKDGLRFIPSQYT